MYIVSRTARFIRGALLSYGPSGVKRLVWNKEFAGTKWSFIDNTTGDCVYLFLEKYSRDGRILDLGCGPGNTANELNLSSYSTYLGIDISEAALAKATCRSASNGRSQKNRFAAGDFLGYQPEGRFDVILFRESLYHVPIGKVKALLDRYSSSLTDRGVFIVRLYVANKSGEVVRRPTRMMKLIEGAFEIVEKGYDSTTGAAVVVFQPKMRIERIG